MASAAWGYEEEPILVRLRAAVSPHHARRAVAVAILGLVGLFVVGAMAVGSILGGARVPLGTARVVGTHELVQLDSRIISGGRYVIVSTTPTGAATGLSPGQTIDMTDWTLAHKLAFAYPTPHVPENALSAHQGFPEIVRAEAFSPATRDVFYAHALNLLVRLVLLASALFIIQFSHGRAALLAGLYLGAAAMADSPTVSFSGLPPALQVMALLSATLARPTAYLFRAGFSMELCPGSRRTKALLWAVFAGLLAVVVVLYLGQIGTLLFKLPPLPLPPMLLPLAQCGTQLFSLLIFGAGAIFGPRPHRFVLRIIFAATLFSTASYIVQEIYLLAGALPPGWLGWYFDIALLGVGIGYPWAIFARRIAGVDFIISRGVVYALALGIILGATELIKLILQAVAGDWVNGFVLLYAVPVLLTLSFAWVARRLERMIQVLLDGDLRNAARILRDLQADFPAATCLEELRTMVAKRAAPALNMQEVTIHLRPSAPVAAAGGLVLPLHVFGMELGVLHCGARPHNKGFDRSERAMLHELAREVAVAVICLDPARRPATLRAEDFLAL